MSSPDFDTVFVGFYKKYAEHIGSPVPTQDLLRGSIEEVEYVEDGNFTICVINTNMGVVAGCSKRNPEDKRLPIRGRSIALVRALHGLLRKFNAA